MPQIIGPQYIQAQSPVPVRVQAIPACRRFASFAGFRRQFRRFATVPGILASANSAFRLPPIHSIPFLACLPLYSTLSILIHSAAIPGQQPLFAAQPSIQFATASFLPAICLGRAFRVCSPLPHWPPPPLCHGLLTARFLPRYARLPQFIHFPSSSHLFWPAVPPASFTASSRPGLLRASRRFQPPLQPAALPRRLLAAPLHQASSGHCGPG